MGIKRKTRAGERWRSRCKRPPARGKELLAPKVTQDPLDDVKPLDTGEDLNRAAALLTDLDINKVRSRSDREGALGYPEYTLESFCPSHGKVRSHSDREGPWGMRRFSGSGSVTVATHETRLPRRAGTTSIVDIGCVKCQQQFTFRHCIGLSIELVSHISRQK